MASWDLQRDEHYSRVETRGRNIVTDTLQWRRTYVHNTGAVSARSYWGENTHTLQEFCHHVRPFIPVRLADETARVKH